MLVELNRTKQANYQNQIMANFEQISQECGNFSLRILLLQQLEAYDSGWNIDTPAGVDSGLCTPLVRTNFIFTNENGKPHAVFTSRRSLNRQVFYSVYLSLFYFKIILPCRQRVAINELFMIQGWLEASLK